MKKTFFVSIIFAMITILSFGQDRTLTMPLNTKTMSVRTWVDSTYMTFSSADNIDSSETYSILIKPEQDCPLQFAGKLVLDSIAGTPEDVTIALKGRVLTSDALTTISTYVWSGSTSDTTLRFSNTSTTRSLALTLPSYGTTLTNTTYTVTVTPDVSSAGADSLLTFPARTITATNAAQSVTGTLTENVASEYYRELWVFIYTKNQYMKIRPTATEWKFYRR